MKQGKCTISIELPLPGGKFKKFEAGTVYTKELDDLDEATIKAYFEAPGISPPKGLLTRGVEAGGNEGVR